MKPLKVEVYVSKGNGEAIPYDSLTKEEKIQLGKRINRRAIAAVMAQRGYKVRFED